MKNQITFSNGVKIQYSVPMSKRLRRLYHFFSRAKPGSRNREKLLLKIKKEFEKQNNKKRDIINKVTHFITTKLYFKKITYALGKSYSAKRPIRPP
ncbi:MAG: hypothetical protein GU362_03940 [Thaumarchaeota archaeon]|nr:hypothetical protein [Nitrososphaerota archaeon]